MGLIVENFTRPCASAGTTGNLPSFFIKSVDNNDLKYRINVVLVSSFVLLHHSSFDKILRMSSESPKRCWMPSCKPGALKGLESNFGWIIPEEK